MTTAVGEPRAAVSVEELKRAWNAVRAGHFRDAPASTPVHAGRAGRAATTRWTPGATERVLPVVGCTGSCGSTTVAVAVATATGSPARVVECGPVTASGLAAASTAELGADESGWVRGSRGEVLLERGSDVLVGVAEVPPPSTPEPRGAVTVLDVAWELGQVLAAPCWLADQVTGAQAVVLVTTATVPGLRRLEAALVLLAGTPAVAAVLGARRRKWAKDVEHASGPLTRALARDGCLVRVPHDPVLAVDGLTARPLPAPLLACASDLLRLTGAVPTPRREPPR